MSSAFRRRLGIALLLLGIALVASGIFLRSRTSGFERVREWMPDIHHAAAEAGVDPYTLAGLVYAESRGKPGAISSIGALGLCQLMPATAAEVAERIKVEGPPYTPQDNLRLGADYLRHMTAYCDGDVDLAILSYRLGPARVRRDVAAAGGQEQWFAEISNVRPSPWGYLEQIKEMRDRFAAADAEEGGAETPDTNDSPEE
jgi:soluble lytic murein transglycosylase-like protein